MNDFLKNIAPTVASAMLGPLGGVAVAAIGKIIGVDGATQAQITKAFQDGKITPEHLAAIKELELKYQAEEAERGFRYADLAFRDRDSARQMQIQTRSQTPAILTWVIVILVIGLEGALLFYGVPEQVSDIIAGRVLGTLDTSLALVLAYWFGSNSGSERTKELLANSTQVK